jgi:hypothetical protein
MWVTIRKKRLLFHCTYVHEPQTKFTSMTPSVWTWYVSKAFSGFTAISVPGMLHTEPSVWVLLSNGFPILRGYLVRVCRESPQSHPFKQGHTWGSSHFCAWSKLHDSRCGIGGGGLQILYFEQVSTVVNPFSSCQITVWFYMTYTIK